MSQHHRLYNNDILKINGNNQTIERVQQYKLLGVSAHRLCAHETCF